MNLQTITAITLDHFYSDPRNAALAFTQACIEGAEDGAKSIAEECEKRGVDLGAAVKVEQERLDRFFHGPQTVSAKPFRIPIQVTR